MLRLGILFPHSHRNLWGSKNTLQGDTKNALDSLTWRQRSESARGFPNSSQEIGKGATKVDYFPGLWEKFIFKGSVATPGFSKVAAHSRISSFWWNIAWKNWSNTNKNWIGLVFGWLMDWRFLPVRGGKSFIFQEIIPYLLCLLRNKENKSLAWIPHPTWRRLGLPLEVFSNIVMLQGSKYRKKYKIK